VGFAIIGRRISENFDDRTGWRRDGSHAVSGTNRGGGGALVLLATMAGVHVSCRVCLAQPSHVPTALLADAELNDVFFLDPDRGWAVGDRGAIWHTEDGGRHWRLQDAPVPCRLEAVWFVDDRRGWIVGGWTHPYTHRTTGIVLRTSDGGQRWETLPSLSLPALKGVKFFDLRNGWALGNASALYPVGVFRTEDGGLSWSSVSATRGASWLSGDFVDAQSGVVAGRQPTVARVQQRGTEMIELPSSGRSNGSLRAVEHPGSIAFQGDRRRRGRRLVGRGRRPGVADQGRWPQLVAAAGTPAWWDGETISIFKAWRSTASGSGSQAVRARACSTRRIQRSDLGVLRDGPILAGACADFSGRSPRLGRRCDGNHPGNSGRRAQLAGATSRRRTGGLAESDEPGGEPAAGSGGQSVRKRGLSGRCRGAECSGACG
jgi:hypothetical protein